MGVPEKFDCKKVGLLAVDIADLLIEVEHLKTAAKEAEEVWRSAETRLHNRQSEFTRAVESQLDHHLIHHPRPLEIA